MDSIIDNYCRVILTGLNVQRGQCLNITAEPCHISVLKRLTAHAYDMGVRYVETQIGSSSILRERLLHSEEQFLPYTPDTLLAKQNVLIKEKWARLSVSSPEDPDVFQDTSQERVVKVQTAMRKAQENISRL